MAKCGDAPIMIYSICYIVPVAGYEWYKIKGKPVIKGVLDI